MKQITSTLILMFSLFTVLPFFAMFLEHIIAGKNSTLQKLLNDISD